MTKVLFITSAYILGHSDGIYYHNSLRDHIDRYKQLGEITLCCRMIERKTCETVLDMSDIGYVRIFPENTIGSLITNIRHNRRIIREEVRKADLVIAYMPSAIGYYATKIAKQNGKKVLLVGIACPWDSLWNHSIKGKLLAPKVWLQTKKAFQHADYALYVTNKFLQNRYPSMGISAGISDVVLPKHDDAYLARRIDRINKTEFNASQEIKLITSAAVNVKYKRQEDVIRAISHLKNSFNLHYYLIGGGDNVRLKSIAKKYNVAERVHFLGFVAHNDIFSILENMDLYIQPSMTEGLSRALVEAMCIAVPCIGSTAGGIPELLPDNSMFKRGDWRSLQKVLEKHLNRQSLIASARSCFAKSAEYETEVLNEKRRIFFNTISNDLKKSRQLDKEL